MTPVQDLLLTRARDAYGRRDFGGAYRGLAEAREGGSLATDDLAMLADAAWWLGLTGEMLALTEEVHARYLEEGHLDRAALHAIELGALWMMRGDVAIGSGWIHRARRLLEGRPPCEAHGFLHYLDVSTALDEQHLDTAVAGAQQLQRFGADIAVPTLVALGLLAEGTARVRQGQLAEGFALLDEAMLPVLADRVPPDWAGNIYCSIILICSDLADVPRARQWVEATERWCRQFSDAVMFLGVCRAHRVQLMTISGDWGRAEEEAEGVRADLADMNVRAVAECDYHLGDVYRFRGDLDAAEEAYARARALGRDPQPGAALLLLSQGRTEAAWGAVSAAIAEAGAIAAAGADPFHQARLLAAYVEIALAGGHVDQAATAAAALASIRQRFPSPGFAAWAEHARGAVLLAQGQPAEARSCLVAACRSYEALPDPFQAARARLLLARALREAGDVAAAAGQEASAAAAIARLGAVAHSVAPRVAGTAPGGLTAREVEVLERVALGASNREVADHLGISEKTVRRHLANIYVKIDVASRTAAAAWAHREGLVGSGR